MALRRRGTARARRNRGTSRYRTRSPRDWPQARPHGRLRSRSAQPLAEPQHVGGSAQQSPRSAFAAGSAWLDDVLPAREETAAERGARAARCTTPGSCRSWRAVHLVEQFSAHSSRFSARAMAVTAPRLRPRVSSSVRRNSVRRAAGVTAGFSAWACGRRTPRPAPRPPFERSASARVVVHSEVASVGPAVPRTTIAAVRGGGGFGVAGRRFGGARRKRR